MPNLLTLTSDHFAMGFLLALALLILGCFLGAARNSDDGAWR